MTAQVFFFNVFSEKDSHLNTVRGWNVWRNIRGRTVLKQEELNFKKRKCHVNLDSITFQ